MVLHEVEDAGTRALHCSTEKYPLGPLGFIPMVLLLSVSFYMPVLRNCIILASQQSCQNYVFSKEHAVILLRGKRYQLKNK